jgi:hypothetical protein
MCDNEGTNAEHVPPYCFFPPGHRLNLITVPSCAEHNLKQSKDDEYVRSIIAPSLGNNSFGLDMALTKVDRSFKHSAGLVAAIFKAGTVVTNPDGSETVAVTVDLKRWDDFFEHFANAIYFHDCQTFHRQRWQILTPNFTLDASILDDKPDPYREVNQKIVAMPFAKQITSNPEIFRYFFYRYNPESYVYKFVSYEGLIVCALSVPEERTSA